MRTDLNRSPVRATHRRITTREAVSIAETLIQVVKSGSTVESALVSIAGTGLDYRSRRTSAGASWAADLLRRIRTGTGIAEAATLTRTRTPDELVVALTVADKTGNLVAPLESARAQLNASRTLASKVEAAATYPLITVTLLAVGLLLLSRFLLPELSAVFGQIARPGAQITVEIARIRAAIARLVAISGAAAVAGSVFIAIVLGRKGLPKPIQRATEGMMFIIPGVGSIARASYRRRAVISLAAGIAAGMDIDSALRLAAASRCGCLIREEITRIRRQVFRGGALPGAIAATRYLAARGWSQRLAAGSASGNLLASLRALSNESDDHLRRLEIRAGALAEPIFTAAAGSAVFLVVATVLVPIFTMLGDLI